ncbi:hypothetical protein C8R46DRAFT_359182 [Mycena filopes]|nr:hypothetical protein C8R46DRAFT_359182 [Mycena filopes]
MATTINLTVFDVTCFAPPLSYQCSLDAAGPHSLLTQNLDFPVEKAKRTTVYLLDPPVPIHHDSGLAVDNTADILRHWGERLTAMAAGFKQGVVEGSLDGAIPAARARIWMGGITLRTLVSGGLDLGHGGLNCVVVPPSTSSPSDLKRRAAEPIEEPESKRQELSASDIAIGPDQQDVRQRIIERAESIITAFTDMDPEIHDPSKTYRIPIPSLHRTNLAQFNLKSESETGDDPCFFYRGRKPVAERILPAISQQTSAAARIGVFGTKGGGKAHLLAVAAALLLRAGRPVVFLALSSDKLRDNEMRDALILALKAAHLDDYIDELFNRCYHRGNKDGLLFVRFCNHLASRGHRLIFVILSYDLLGTDDAKRFRGITSGHIVCFSAGPNSELCNEVEQEVAGGRCWYKAVYINGGLDQDELAGWLSDFKRETSISLRSEDIGRLTATTGNAPSLVCKVFKAMKDDAGFEAKQLEIPGIDYDRLLITYYERVIADYPSQRPEVGRLLRATLNNSYFARSEYAKWLVDRRFIYRDEGSWRFQSLFAHQAVLRLEQRWQTTGDDGVGHSYPSRVQ